MFFFVIFVVVADFRTIYSPILPARFADNTEFGLFALLPFPLALSLLTPLSTLQIYFPSLFGVLSFHSQSNCLSLARASLSISTF